MKKAASVSLTLALALVAAASCNKNNNPAPGAAVSADAGAATPTAGDAGAAPAPSTQGPSEAVPANALVGLRGGSLRKVLNLIAPGAPTRLALGQVIPGITPGVGEHGVDLDPDAPFAALMVTGQGANGRAPITVAAAWPLRPGMSLAQDAQALRGYRQASPGVYRPTSDAPQGDGGVAAPPCWVARRAPVGWVLLCGPTEVLERNATWFVAAASQAPEGDAVLDATLRAERVRAVFAQQIEALEAQDPRRTGQGAERARVEAYDEAHRSALNTKQLVDDLSLLHLRLTVDENAYHIRGEGEFARATGASTRAIVGTAVGHRAAVDLLVQLPATVNSYFAAGLDMSAFAPLLSPPEEDPRARQMLGPEFVRFQQSLNETTGFRRSGERAMGFLAEDGGTKIELIRVADPAAAITALRNAAVAVPRTPRPSGMNPADQFAVLPNPPGVPAGTLRMRLGPDPARLPPNVPAEVRRMYQRSVLVVPQEGFIMLIDAADPAARFRALSQGPRLTVTANENQPLLVHLTAAGVLSMLGAPAGTGTNNGDPVEGTLTTRRVGDNGGHFDLSLDAPIVTVNNVRDTVAALQAQAMEQAQRQRQAMQQAQQAQRRAGPGGGGGGPLRLPEPNVQLQPPGGP